MESQIEFVRPENENQYKKLHDTIHFLRFKVKLPIWN